MNLRSEPLSLSRHMFLTTSWPHQNTFSPLRTVHPHAYPARTALERPSRTSKSVWSTWYVCGRWEGARKVIIVSEVGKTTLKRRREARMYSTMIEPYTRRAPANVMIKIRPLTNCNGLPVCPVLSSILCIFASEDMKRSLPTPRVPMYVQERCAPGTRCVMSVRR